ncbi:MAG: bifunctional proline dehydrogenase/L-glutamate gamma-semialdehyde dehydrogenase, partial [Methylovulum sp.]
MTQQSIATLRAAINRAYLADEKDIIGRLSACLGAYDAGRVGEFAETLVNAVRTKKHRQTATEAFLHEYRLDSDEGIVLMGLAEALLRIPDSRTQDRFLQEKLCSADWQSHLRHSDSVLVNLSTQALSITREFEHRLLSEASWFPVFEQLLLRMGAPLIRSALKQAMWHLSLQFVFAESMQGAVQRCEQYPAYRFSFDMLGEAALT